MIEIESDKQYMVRELGPLRLSIDEDRITVGKRRQVAEKVIKIKRSHIKDLKDFPMLDNETVSAWESRVAEEKSKRAPDAEEQRRPGESTEAYLDRIMTPELGDLPLIYDLLHLILEEFDDPKKLTKKLFEELPLEPTIAFIKEVLRKLRVNVEAIFPGTFRDQALSGVGEPS